MLSLYYQQALLRLEQLAIVWMPAALLATIALYSFFSTFHAIKHEKQSWKIWAATSCVALFLAIAFFVYLICCFMV